MRVLGVDLSRASGPGPTPGHTLALLDDQGRATKVLHSPTLPEVALRAVELAAGEPFLLGVNVPVVVPAKPARARPVENLVRRRFGVRLPPGGRASLAGAPQGVQGETLIAALAAAGQPCLPFPDRDRRRPGLLETYPELILKAILWESSAMAGWERDDLGEFFRAQAARPYRVTQLPARATWVHQAVALERLLRELEPGGQFDGTPVHAALARASSLEETESAAAILDSLLMAGMARRYLETAETCLFVGDQESGYVILPADGFVRRLANDARPSRGRLFPPASLRQRLGDSVRLRVADLLPLPGRPQRLEATFPDPPRYEFENLDEMLWWKHTRHVAGPQLPTEGLAELVVTVGRQAPPSSADPLRLVRSRHRTLSFRFEPPAAWRNHVPTRDGKAYDFAVLRATYETLADE